MRKSILKLLKIKEIEERERRRELFSVIEERRRVEEEKKSLQGKLLERSNDFISLLQEGIPAGSLAYNLKFFDGLIYSIKKMDEMIRNLGVLEEEKRKVYLSAKKERDIVSRVLENMKYEEFIENMKRDERFSDEIVLIRKGRIKR